MEGAARQRAANVTKRDNRRTIMSTRTEPLNWTPVETTAPEDAKNLSEIEVECLVRNSDQRNLVAALRRCQAGAALDCQRQWDDLFAQRELLRNQIKRGKECLDQIRNELATLRAHLEEWPDYERICGKNPLTDYMQSISSKERIEQFLPGWLDRQETQLRSINSAMECFAKQNGLEHLL